MSAAADVVGHSARTAEGFWERYAPAVCRFAAMRDGAFRS